MSVASSHLLTGDFAALAEKAKLLQALAQEKQIFLDHADDFYDKNLRTQQDYIALCKSVIDTVDRVLAAGNWQDSLFLRNTAKPLQRLREEAQELYVQFSGAHARKKPTVELVGEKQNLYISLFQANGHDLLQWAAQLGSLDRYVMGRPIYATEEAVRTTLRAKPIQTSEAYAVIAVDKGAILNGDNALLRQDRLGQTLITVAAGHINASHVIEFVHMNRHYDFYNQRLWLKDAEVE